MKEFDEIKETFLKKAVDVADKTKELAKTAADKAKNIARITRLTAEIAGEKDIIKKNYSELGRLYYAKYKEEPADNEFEQLIEEIKAAEERIEIKKAEIEELKAEGKDYDYDEVDVEFYVEDDEPAETETVAPVPEADETETVTTAEETEETTENEKKENAGGDADVTK